jgi:hypothetical protein
MKAQARRRPRGVVLIAVLLLLVLLSLLVASYYNQSEDSLLTAQASARQQVAVSHAQQGAEQAVYELRGGLLNVGTLVGQCCPASPPGDPACIGGDVPTQCTVAGSFIQRGPIDNGQVGDLENGAGLQYQFFVFRRPGAPLNRYTVQSTGYAGYALASPNLITSQVEVEIEIGQGSTFKCVNSYECT